MAITVKFTKKCRNTLIGAGTIGLSYANLLQKVRTPGHGGADLRGVLNSWHKRRWVDNFERRMPSGQYSQIWRATNLLADEWPVIERAMIELAVAPDLPLGQAFPLPRTAGPVLVGLGLGKAR